MKSLFPIIAAGFVLAGCQTTGAQNSLTQPFEGFGSEKAIVTSSDVKSVAYNPQYARNKDFIKTPIRDFKVPDNFTMIDDWNAFWTFHDDNIRGRFPDSGGGPIDTYATHIDIDKCLYDLQRTNTITAAKTPRASNVAILQAMCYAGLAQRFAHAPRKGVETYKQILTYWIENDVVKDWKSSANKLPLRGNNARVDWVYHFATSVSKLASHYSLWHKFYNFDDEMHQKVDDLFTTYAARFTYFDVYKQSGPFFMNLCNIKSSKPKIWTNGTNDHCGSYNMHQAVGLITYGLEFENQLVFDRGVQHLEIMIAAFDKNHMYRSHIGRGEQGLSYSVSMGPAIDQIDYLLDKAFGFDLINMETVHGTTPGKTWANLYNVAHNPSLMKPYWSKNNGTYNDQFAIMIKKIEAGKLSPRSLWNAFDLRNYFTQAPTMAKQFYPDQYKQHMYCVKNASCRHRFLTDDQVMGWSNLQVRLTQNKL